MTLGYNKSESERLDRVAFASSRVIITSNIARTGEVRNHKSVDMIVDFFKTCKEGKEAEKSFKILLEDLTKGRSAISYWTYFKPIVDNDPKVYLAAAKKLRQGDKKSAKFLTDFFDKMMNYFNILPLESEKSFDRNYFRLAA